MAGNSPVYSHGCKSPLPVAEGVAGKPSCKPLGRKPYFRYSSQGCRGLTLYGYARVSVREPEDKNLDLQVEQLTPPRPHPGDERRKLPPQAQPGNSRVPSSRRSRGRIGRTVNAVSTCSFNVPTLANWLLTKSLDITWVGQF